MKVEVRNGTVHISGYVNAVLRESHPVITPHGKANELVEERAFQRALEKTSNIPAWLDHNPNREIAITTNQSLELREDNIGLHADLVTSDPEVVANADKLTGWSWGFRNPKDTMEQREGKLPLRRISSFDLDHVALLLHKQPAYSATSVELRAETEESIEIRTSDDTPVVVDKSVETPSAEKETPNNSRYENRLLEITHNL